MRKIFKHISDKIVCNKRVLSSILLLATYSAIAQPRPNPSTDNWQLSPGVLGTFILIVIVLFIAFLILYMRINSHLKKIRHKSDLKNKYKLAEELIGLEESEIDRILEERKAAQTYTLSGEEIAGTDKAQDKRGIVSKVTHKRDYPLVDEKRLQKFISKPLGL